MYLQELDRCSCFTSKDMELRAYWALACQLVDRVVETYVSARLDPIAEAGPLFVVQCHYVVDQPKVGRCRHLSLSRGRKRK